MVRDSQSLYRKIYFRNPDFPGPVTLQVLKSYKNRLLGIPQPSDDESWELTTVADWIRQVSCSYSDIDEVPDPGEAVFDKYIATLFEQIDKVLPSPPYYVSLHHTLIVLGLQKPRPFLERVKWLNELRIEHGFPEVLAGSAKNNVSKYLGNPKNTKWILKEYLEYEHKSSQQAINHFRDLVNVCHLLEKIILSDNLVEESR